MVVQCLAIGIVLVVSGLPLVVAGLIIRDRYKTLLDVSKPYLFWLGRDRVVLNVGRTCLVVGSIVVGLGLCGLWIGFHIHPM